MQRHEKYFVPEAALRETLLNALCHSRYNYGVPIQISVYEDKLYIANCGCLPENLTVTNLMEKHASRPFNPNIAYVFYLAGFIESWGRGIEKICSACKKEGIQVPKFTINPEDIMVEFSAPEELVVHRPDRVTDKEMAVISMLKEDPGYTYADLCKRLNVSRKTISAIMKNLKEKNWL